MSLTLRANLRTTGVFQELFVSLLGSRVDSESHAQPAVGATSLATGNPLSAVGGKSDDCLGLVGAGSRVAKDWLAP